MWVRFRSSLVSFLVVAVDSVVVHQGAVVFYQAGDHSVDLLVAVVDPILSAGGGKDVGEVLLAEVANPHCAVRVGRLLEEASAEAQCFERAPHCFMLVGETRPPLDVGAG